MARPDRHRSSPGVCGSYPSSIRLLCDPFAPVGRGIVWRFSAGIYGASAANCTTAQGRDCLTGRRWRPRLVARSATRRRGSWPQAAGASCHTSTRGGYGRSLYLEGGRRWLGTRASHIGGSSPPRLPRSRWLPSAGPGVSCASGDPARSAGRCCPAGTAGAGSRSGPARAVVARSGARQTWRDRASGAPAFALCVLPCGPGAKGACRRGHRKNPAVVSPPGRVRRVPSQRGTATARVPRRGRHRKHADKGPRRGA